MSLKSIKHEERKEVPHCNKQAADDAKHAHRTMQLQHSQCQVVKITLPLKPKDS
jgi:hypothetical protein